MKNCWVPPHVARVQKWDRHWLGLAHYMSRVSKDPSTKVGAVIIRPDMTLAAVGFNGFARGMCDHEHLYENREEKYSRIIHGEMNAILNAHGPVDGCTLYTTPFAPCDRCAVMVIQSGIQRVVAPTLPDHLQERWGASLAKTTDFFKEAGVTFDLVDVDLDSILIPAGVSQCSIHTSETSPSHRPGLTFMNIARRLRRVFGS